MDFEQLARARYSLRKFSDKPVDRATVERILEIGQLAPTALNYQPQRTLVLDSAEALEKLKSLTKYHFNAPLTLLVCYDSEVSWTRPVDGRDSGDMDATLVIAHLMFAATEMGLGSTFVMGFEPAAVAEAYGIPGRLVPVALLPMGYPAENAKPAHLHDKREPISKTTFYNDFSAWTGE